MKNHLILMGLFAAFLVIIPCVAFFNNGGQAAVPADADSEHVKILFVEGDKVESISIDDYVIGAVFAQMPVDFEDETLKAQAVLAYTYAFRRQLSENDSPTESLKGAIMSDDTSLYQNYFTTEQAKELYGDDYDIAYKKISAAVKAVKGEILTYDNEPIIVAFHAISGGTTESAKNAWGEDVPYLTSVDSSWDLDISGCEKQTEFTADELKARLMTAFPDADLEDLDEDEWIITDGETDAGTVQSVQIGSNCFVTGSQFSQELSLPSAYFEVAYSSKTFTITSKGYGHLVGMSQYGANFMAKEGSNYKEILAHYFTGTKITKNT